MPKISLPIGKDGQNTQVDAVLLEKITGTNSSTWTHVEDGELVPAISLDSSIYSDIPALKDKELLLLRPNFISLSHLGPNYVSNMKEYFKVLPEISGKSGYLSAGFAVPGTRPLNSTVYSLAITDTSIAHRYNIFVNCSSDGKKYLVVKHYTKNAPQADFSLSDRRSSLISATGKYFVFNFAVTAPGAPCTYYPNDFSELRGTYQQGESVMIPGGGSGAGGQFTAVLNIDSDNVDSDGNSEDNVVIHYIPATVKILSTSRYSSTRLYEHYEKRNLDSIDQVTVRGNFGLTTTSGTVRYYSSIAFPGGWANPPYYFSMFSPTTLETGKGVWGICNLTHWDLPALTTIKEGGALILHHKFCCQPEPTDNLFTVYQGEKAQHSHPFSVFNPERLFGGSSTPQYTVEKGFIVKDDTETKVFLPVGTFGKPSLFSNPEDPVKKVLGLYYGPDASESPSAGAGGTGYYSADGLWGTPNDSNVGGLPAITLSW